MARIRAHLKGNLVAYVALFIGLGGVSYAAVDLKKNSVGEKEIEKNAVGKSELQKNAVRSKEVKNSSLKARDFADGQLPQGEQGPVGPRGPEGPAGADGEDVGPTEFGVVRLYKNGTEDAANWSPDIPDDGNNAAQVSGVTVLPCTGDDVFSLEAAVRSDEEDGGQAGGGLVVTYQSGDLLGGDVTPANPAFDDLSVVAVEAYPKSSGEPIGGDDPELASVTVPTATPPGQCVIEGTAQFFDLDDTGGTEG